MMKTKRNYRPPMIVREVSIQPEGDILKESFVDNLLIESTGQQVDSYNFSSMEEDNPFNVQWE